METKDHFHLAKLITSKTYFGTKIEREAFEFGCIYPDINLLTYIKGHTHSSTIDGVKKILIKLYGNIEKPMDYFNLGKAIHFIGDYFTFPHTPFFKGTISEHISYEHNLHEYIVTNGKSLNEFSFDDITNAQKCIDLIVNLMSEYFDTSHSIPSDWHYIQYACVGISLSSIKCKSAEKHICPWLNRVIDI